MSNGPALPKHHHSVFIQEWSINLHSCQQMLQFSPRFTSQGSWLCRSVPGWSSKTCSAYPACPGSTQVASRSFTEAELGQEMHNSKKAYCPLLAPTSWPNSACFGYPDSSWLIGRAVFQTRLYRSSAFAYFQSHAALSNDRTFLTSNSRQFSWSGSREVQQAWRCFTVVFSRSNWRHHWPQVNLPIALHLSGLQHPLIIDYLPLASLYQVR